MYGTLIKNPAGQILISSEIEALHFGGEASLISYDRGLRSFPGYSGYSLLSGRNITRWIFDSISPPVFFIFPYYQNYYANQYFSILQQFNVGYRWYVDVIAPYSTQFTVYAFVAPSDAPIRRNATNGFATYLPDGRPAFDSRKYPLSILAAVTATTPYIPFAAGTPTNQSGFGWNDNTLDFDFSTFNKNSYAIPPTGTLMFTAPALVQSVYTRQKNGFKRSYGFYSSQGHWSTAVWWAMCFEGYGVWSNQLHAGWNLYDAGYQFSSTWEDDSNWWEFTNNSGSYTSGRRPYNDKTINYGSNVIIIADASPYSRA